MFESLLEAVRAEVSGARALETVWSLARFHRIQASPGYDAGAEWLAGAAGEAGLSAELQAVPGDGRTRFLGAVMPEGWECRRAVATLVAGTERETLADWDEVKLSLIQRSAPVRGRFPVVVLEDGTEDDHYRGLEVRGRVVVTRGAVMRVHQLAVMERGAAGILFDGRRLMPPVREAHHDPDSVAYASFWWGPDVPRGWGFVLSPARGERLRSRLALGQALEVEVEVDSRSFETRLPLVSALLPAARQEAAGGEVLIVAHLCHPQPGANDNASGVAAALESARALQALRRRGALPPLARGVRFLWVPEIYGSYAWLGSDPSRAGRLAAALNLDMVGEDQQQCGSTFLLEHPPCFAGSFAEELVRLVRERAQEWVTSYSGPGHYSLARLGEVPYSGGSDHSLFLDPGMGVPCPMLVQWPDRYYHSSLDTPERCDPRSLALAARTAATYGAFLASMGDAEREWLTRLVGRGARRRLLHAAQGTEPGRMLEAERVRGRAALASLARLGAEPGALRSARRALDEFCAHEGFLEHDEVLRTPTQPEGPRWARVHGAPLDPARHLWPGWWQVPREEREAYLGFEAALPGGATTLEVAWYACDGRRTLDEIAHLVWLETGHHVPEMLEGFFAWTLRLGLVRPAPEEGEE